MATQLDTQILIFGSQTLFPTEESFTGLRETLLSSSAFQWILEVIDELQGPAAKAAADVFPHLDFVPGAKLLDSWIKTGQLPGPLPNSLVTPLVVIGHLVQFIQYKELSGKFSSAGAVETLGFCTGLLSAFAISSSGDEAQSQKYGAAAVRLAAFIGAAVDAQNFATGAEAEAVSLSAAWKSNDGETALKSILSQYPEAYISVNYDHRRATITTSSKNVTALTEQLKYARVTVTDIGLSGRFHSQAHVDKVEEYIKFVESNPSLQLPDASELYYPTRSNDDGEQIKEGKLHEIAIRSMLVNTSNWYESVSTVFSSSLASQNSNAVVFGADKCVPSSLASKLGPRLLHVADYDERILRLSSSKPNVPDSRIAVIGMACNVPGATNVDDYWDVLCEGKSQHVEVPSERVKFNSIWRESDKTKKWYGNFIQDYDSFDHKFFKKSPREMASTDPQQRQVLQVVYQAVEQSGYFSSLGRRSKGDDLNIAFYLGVGLDDYEKNIACHPANAYSATGNLRSFGAGKVSHYFGWTGPSLTIDTACSSSAVAVHHACKAILSGESIAAVAGGVNMMTGSDWYHNLAGASFLSPTGQCKPFDAKGDGYCRGEGVGAVFLKKYTDALADGNQILGVIAATSVMQNRNCTAITVPDSRSLSDMFRFVTRQAGLEPKQVSVVEAHGTGTPVGDPAEYSGIREVFGGTKRSNTLALGSVKGLIGHTESASGLTSLIKSLLMIHYGYIPPQASHDTVNPSLKMTPEDKIQIYTKLTPWDARFRAILINNYGASGSNASMVVTQAPTIKSQTSSQDLISKLTTRYPFWISGFDDRSLVEYSAKLLKFIHRRKNTSLANLAFQVSLQSNRTLPRALIFDAGSIDELQQILASFPEKQGKFAPITPPAPRPVILCFGGQISTFVGLDRDVYENAGILRKYLDQVDAASRTVRQNGSIYPGIFQKEAVEDVVDLQTQLFAIQYSVAMAWIETGVNVAAVVGHSFGELTSLTVSGILSLEDGLRLVLGRARIIKESWGADKGAMIAIEGDLQVVNDLLAAANQDNATSPATIACYNGPTSFTLGGSVEAIDRVEAAIAKDTNLLAIKSKRLNVTNAFHSTLVEPLLDQLTEVGKSLNFKNATIPFERSTESSYIGKLRATYVAEHMRQPVFFNHALQRLSQKYPNAIYLEAGSNSTITVMASRALGKPAGSHFQALSINAGNSLRPLTDATVNLWREGINATFWPHHHIQTSDYTPLLLPPYQFEKSRHWMEVKDVPKPNSAPTIVQRPVSSEMWEFVRFDDEQQRSALFAINTDSKEFNEYVSGHKIAGSVALCPSILQISIITAALISILPNFNDSKLQPHLKHMISHAPMTLNPNKAAWLRAEAVDVDRLVWDFSVVSQDADKPTGPFLLHFSLRLTLRSSEDEDVKNEFAQYERLITAKRARGLLNGDIDVDEVIQGRNVYRAFSDIVDYNDRYRGVQKIAGKDGESAGRVSWPYNPKHYFNVGLADSFLQVAGIFVNCMTDRSEKEMFISDRIEQWIRSPRLVASAPRPSLWDVYACHHQPSQKEYLCDVFAFDANTGELAEVILGLRFQRVTKAGLIRVLGGSIPSAHSSVSKPVTAAPLPINGTNGHSIPSKTLPSVPSAPQNKKLKKGPSVDVVKVTTEILMNLSGLDAEDVKDDAELAELGIDSLMGMELCREIELNFKITYDSSELNDLTDFKDLIQSISKVIGIDPSDEGKEEDKEELISNGHPQVPVPGVTNGHNTNGFNGVHVETNGSSATLTDRDATQAILDAFSRVNTKTDEYLLRGGIAGFVDNLLDDSNRLVVVHILDAFEQLGCPIRHVEAGTKLTRIEHLPKHKRQVDKLYRFLEEAGLVVIDGETIIRAAGAAPIDSARSLLESLVKKNLDHESDHRLTSHIGFSLADCLIGKQEGIQLIFSSPEGRKYANEMYGKSPIQTAWMEEMKDVIKSVVKTLYNETSGPIKILEIGAGTGGTTSNLIDDLAKFGIPFEFTATDLSSSLVAGLRKRFKEHSFMKFKVLDVEKEPPKDLVGSQHLILSTNCVHATRNLKVSTKNIHTMLHPNGALLLLELTKPIYWFDLVFGMVEGWWLFEDGREHALAKPEFWQKVMTSVGYGHVDWSDGKRPENEIQRLILATASSASRYDGPPHPLLSEKYWTDLPAREVAVDSYVEQFTADFSLAPSPTVSLSSSATPEGTYVVLTGATGSLGGQLAAYFARLEEVRGVFCLNRPSRVDPVQRQKQSMENRGVSVDQRALMKLKIFETDTSKPFLGLSPVDYEILVGKTTHIVHNAWPMSLTREIQTFKSQFRVMRNLINLARDIAAVRKEENKASLLFVSSIATIGYNPLHARRPLVPEEPMQIESVLPTGYGDAKLVCERMIERTLGRYSNRFRSMAVRIGQIAGSADSGYWNPTEHFSFLVKSSLTLQALPQLSGELSWCPVNDVAASLGELVLAENTPYAVYHVENPSRQPWSEMIPIIAEALGIPLANVIPFNEWVTRVKTHPGSVDKENPAAKLIDFLDLHFHRMSCGGLVMDTTHAREHSKTMAEEPPVSAALLYKFVKAWKEMGFLP